MLCPEAGTGSEVVTLGSAVDDTAAEVSIGNAISRFSGLTEEGDTEWTGLFETRPEEPELKTSWPDAGSEPNETPEEAEASCAWDEPSRA
jgi:hypothetical protein